MVKNTLTVGRIERIRSGSYPGRTKHGYLQISASDKLDCCVAIIKTQKVIKWVKRYHEDRMLRSTFYGSGYPLVLSIITLL